MTSKIFNEWLAILDQQQQFKKERIAILMDNATVHKIFDTTILNFIDVYFLPPNTTSVL